MSLIDRTVKQFGPIHKGEMTWAELKAHVESMGIEGVDPVRACILSIWTAQLPSTPKSLISFDAE